MHMKNILACDNDEDQPEIIIPSHLRAAVIFDNVSFVPFLKSSIVRDLCTNGRCYGIEIINTTMYVKDIIPEIRQNVDYFGILATDNLRKIREIWEEFLSNIISFDEFTDLVVKYTVPTGSMICIDIVSTSKELADKIFVYQSHNKELGPIICDPKK